MNRLISALLAVSLTAAVAFSFSGCNLFATMRKNAEEAANTTLCETPGDDEAFAELNSVIASAFDKADISESVSYSVGGVSVRQGDEDAGILDDAANLLKGLIMKNNPGSSSREITDRSDAGLLVDIDRSAVLDYELTRDTVSERVTNEHGDEMLDDNGEFVTEVFNSDNNLNYVIRYYSTEKTPNADGGEDVSFTPADGATIESVFGAQADKDAVIADFAGAADYIGLNDYSIEYGNCEIRASVDMAAGEVLSLEFIKRMNVTADAEGAGSLASYGKLTVEFELTQKTSYGFAYPVPEE